MAQDGRSEVGEGGGARRIISFRKANKREEQAYGKAFG